MAHSQPIKVVKSISARAKQMPRPRIVHLKKSQQKRKTKVITRKAMSVAWSKTVKRMLGDMRAKKKIAASSAPAAAPSASSQAIGSQPSSSSTQAEPARSQALRSGSQPCGIVPRQKAALAAISDKSKKDKNAWERAEAKNGLAPPVTPLRVPGVCVSTKKREEQETKGINAAAKRRSEADAKRCGAEASARSQKIHLTKTSKHGSKPTVAAKPGSNPAAKPGSKPAVAAKPGSKPAVAAKPRAQMKRALRSTFAKWLPTPPALKKQRLEVRAELNNTMQAWIQQWGSVG